MRRSWSSGRIGRSRIRDPVPEDHLPLELRGIRARSLRARGRPSRTRRSRGRGARACAPRRAARGCAPCPCGTTGIGEADHVDALVEQVARPSRCASARVAEHDRHDRVHARADVEARRGHRLRGSTRVFASSRSRSAVVCVEQLERARAARRDHRRRQRVGEEVRAASAGAGGRRSPSARGEAAAGAAERLAERRGDDVDAAHARRSARACRGRSCPMKPVAWRVVDHHQRAVLARRGRRSRRAARRRRPSRTRRRSRSARTRAACGLLQLAPRGRPCRRSRSGGARPCRGGRRR